MAEETKGTVLLALSANLGVGIAKGVGGALTGSSALLAEAAHSLADCLNEVFLLLSLSRSQRPADRSHPFGYGAERFFWSLLAAVGIFVTGALFSIYEGVHSLLHAPSRETSTREFLVIYAVLLVALVLESISLRKALQEVRQGARTAGRKVLVYVRRSPDPTVKTVATEDTIAVLGVLVATVGTVLHQLSGSEVPDAVASIVIGLLLAYVAVVLGKDTKDLLIGEAADPAVRLNAYETLMSHPEVTGIKELLTMQLGPDNVLVAGRVQFAESLTTREITRVCTEVEREMHERVPSLTQVFLDPSAVEDGDERRVQQRLARTVEEVREVDGEQALQRIRGARSRTGQALTRGSTRLTEPRRRLLAGRR